MCTNPKSVNHWHTKSTACVKKKKEGKKGHHYTQARTTFCCTTIIHVFFQMPSQSWLVSNRISTSCQPQNSHLRMNTITKSIFKTGWTPSQNQYTFNTVLMPEPQTSPTVNNECVFLDKSLIQNMIRQTSKFKTFHPLSTAASSCCIVNQHVACTFWSEGKWPSRQTSVQSNPQRFTNFHYY